jgi:hypothetical protein
MIPGDDSRSHKSSIPGSVVRRRGIAASSTAEHGIEGPGLGPKAIGAGRKLTSSMGVTRNRIFPLRGSYTIMYLMKSETGVPAGAAGRSVAVFPRCRLQDDTSRCLS